MRPSRSLFGLTELVTLGWDLPGSHGWENDGVAPRDLFGGLANNLTPGHAHRYPLLHYLVLAVPCLPVLVDRGTRRTADRRRTA